MVFLLYENWTELYHVQLDPNKKKSHYSKYMKRVLCSLPHSVGIAEDSTQHLVH